MPNKLFKLANRQKQKRFKAEPALKDEYSDSYVNNAYYQSKLPTILKEIKDLHDNYEWGLQAGINNSVIRQQIFIKFIGQIRDFSKSPLTSKENEKIQAKTNEAIIDSLRTFLTALRKNIKGEISNRISDKNQYAINVLLRAVTYVFDGTKSVISKIFDIPRKTHI